MSTTEGVQYSGGYYHKYTGVPCIWSRGIFSTAGDTMSTSGDTMIHVVQYYEYIRSVYYLGDLKTMVLKVTVLVNISYTCIMVSSGVLMVLKKPWHAHGIPRYTDNPSSVLHPYQCTAHTLYRVKKNFWPKTFTVSDSYLLL